MSEIRRQIVFLDEQLLVPLYVTPEDVGLAVVKVPRRDEHQVILPDPDASLHLPSNSAEARLPVDALHDDVVATLDLDYPSQYLPLLREDGLLDIRLAEHLSL